MMCAVCVTSARLCVAAQAERPSLPLHVLKRWRCMVQSLAVDISLAALLGDNIYNFGELLLHPIVRPANRFILPSADYLLLRTGACVPAHKRPSRHVEAL